MEWFSFSLAGASSLAVTGIIDKFILGRYVRNPLPYLLALVILQQIFALGILAFAGPGFIYPYSFYALAAGAAQVALWISYLRALQIEETSRIAALVYVYPAFVFLGANVLLGETLTRENYAGGIILVCSALLVSLRPEAGRGLMSLSPALKYMVIFWIFTAAYALAAKYLLSFMDEWHLIMWSSLGNMLLVLPLFGGRGMRDETLGYFRGGTFLFLVLLADEIFDFLGRSAFIFAYARGSAALVSCVGALQPFITFLYVILLGLFIPGILREELDARTVLQKLAAFFLIVIGVYLVS